MAKVQLLQLAAAAVAAAALLMRMLKPLCLLLKRASGM
jgi:hypothetical protein